MEKPIGHHALDGGAGGWQVGLTLIEALLVLAIASRVVATAVTFYNAARVKQQTIQIVA